jgi:carbonic anhydrase
MASLSCAKDTSKPFPSAELNRFLTPLINVCGEVRKEMGINDGEEPSKEEEPILIKKATEANVKAQVEKLAACKIIQSNWAGKNLSLPGEPKYKIKVHG